MSLTAIRKRIDKIQKSKEQIDPSGGLYRVIELIAKGAYYDELTEDEKEAYCKYTGGNRDGLETLAEYFGGDLHFQLEPKRKPPTEHEFEIAEQEVEAAVDEIVKRFNSPEERAKREADYQELQQIGALRKAAFEQGESMSNYPLPWEKAEK